MIVYNVKRRWFTEKALADKYRIAEGLRPPSLLRVTVDDRDDLAALLNALCEPLVSGTKAHVAAVEVIGGQEPLNALLDRAYVETGKDIPDCVPDFLLKAHGVTR